MPVSGGILSSRNSIDSENACDVPIAVPSRECRLDQNAHLRTFPRWITLVRMTFGRVERWYPVLGLAERPASIFDVSWQGGEQQLIVSVRYAADVGEDSGIASAVVIFNDVFAFQVLSENMELSGVADDDAALLNLTYPYGGRWPYLEVHDSDWIKQLAERDGAWNAGDFRHLVITSRNMHLHVASRPLSLPSYHPAA